MLIKRSVERAMQCIPEIIQSGTWSVVVVDSFDGQKFSTLDPVSQFPGTSTFVCNFLNFVIEEGSFGVFD